MSEEQIVETGSTNSVSATLVLLRGGQPSDVSFVIGERAVVGRFDPAVGPVDVDLGPTPEGVYVSRKHAEIWHEAGKWMVKDLGSSNGTFVLLPGQDFERIDGDREINSGQQVSFGNARFVFEVADASADASEESAAVEVESPAESEDPADAPPTPEATV
ncbi:MAG: FHA domain-containing protein [Fimbriimonadales bacterium]